LNGKRFPWGDTISQNQASYYASPSYAYDLSGAVNGCNPAYATGVEPFTSPVGSFPSNGYGLYDMAGNVRQWCWDRYGTVYSGGLDPRGPATGSERILRGGGWNFFSKAALARTAKRVNFPLSVRYDDGGFRLARGGSAGVATWAPVVSPVAVSVLAGDNWGDATIPA
jgi:formylglycine-generating enzyme required for sulfatase activity